MKHTTDYRTGTWIDETAGVYVGWALRPGTCAGFPMQNEDGAISLVVSGEDFPAPEAVASLKRKGHQFTDAAWAHAVHLYEEDPNFPVALNGRFHGILLDRNRRRTTLFCDRYGMHRLYYQRSGDTFYFAAEAKAILSVVPECARLDSRSLGEWISCGCVLGNRSLFSGLSVLPAGSAWQFENGTLTQQRAYFEPSEWESQQTLSSESYYQQLRQVYTSVLPRYCGGREKVGVSLTGGLDSRMIMAWAKFAPGTVPCYSFGSVYRDCEDVAIARKVAALCRQPHHIIPVGPSFLSRFSDYAERTVWLTDGCCTVNRASDLYINERAREFAPARLTGNYGGEVLRRVRAFKPGDPAQGLYDESVLTSVATAKETYASLIDCHPLSFAVFRQAPWHHFGLLALEETQMPIRTPFLDNEFVQTVFQAPEQACANSDVCLRLISDGDSALAGIPTDRGLGGRQNPWMRMLRHQFLEFTFKAEYAYDYGMPQPVAQVDYFFRALHLERLFLGRHKFAHYRVWYRDALAEYVREILLDSRSLSRPYLQKGQVQKIVAGHLEEGRNFTVEIHQLLTLELLHRLFLDVHC